MSMVKTVTTEKKMVFIESAGHPLSYGPDKMCFLGLLGTVFPSFQLNDQIHFQISACNLQRAYKPFGDLIEIQILMQHVWGGPEILRGFLLVLFFWPEILNKLLGDAHAD